MVKSISVFTVRAMQSTLVVQASNWIPVFTWLLAAFILGWTFGSEASPQKPKYEMMSVFQKAEGLDLSFIPLSETDLPERIKNSIVRIDFENLEVSTEGDITKPGHCTGVYISQSRDILTAAHCIEACTFRGPASLGQDHTGKTCRVRINGEPAVVQVQMMSQCTLNATYDVKIGRAMGGTNPAIPEQCAHQADVAIVRPKTLLSKKFSCLPMSKDYQTNQKVFTVGYPGFSARSNYRTFDSDGSQPYYSRGRIVKQRHCDLKQRAPASGPLEIDGYRYPVGSAVAIPREVSIAGTGKIQTTVDIVGGSSGSPLLNTRGEIVGIASFVFNEAQGPTTECAGAAYFEPAPVSRIPSNIVICK